MKKYTGNRRREICFPIGGIGTGCIGLDGTGRLRDWEIFNRPNKGSLNGFTHFGIKAQREGKTIDARVMNGDLLSSCMGQYTDLPGYHSYGYGPSRSEMSGVPHFKDTEFEGEFPLAKVNFIDETFPASVSLEAFNPFIPSNDKDSSIPAAFFTACVKNTTPADLTYTFELTVNNPSKNPHIHNTVKTDAFTGVELSNALEDSLHPEYGSLIFGVPGFADTAIQHYWYRGSWFDGLGIFWQDFMSPGKMKDRQYENDGAWHEDLATVTVTKTLKSGESWRQRFLLGWFYPNYVNYWSDDKGASWKNHYAVMFENAVAVAEYASKEWSRMEAETRLFHDALYASSLPECAMEAVGANLSVLNSATVLRLTDGEFYGWEGCASHEGSCEGSCTHVWNYTQALPFLFPKLERSMRELDYTYNLAEDGRMPFRLQLPLGKKMSHFRACVDGQMGGIIKSYREWKLSGDNEWLKKWWPSIKKSLEYAWSDTNSDRWDPEKTGVITGRQHHTLDMELFGPNGWLNGFYVGALKAASEMAQAVGDPDAETYWTLYENGRAYTDAHLFNGEYYFQKIDVRDLSVLDPYVKGDTLTGASTLEAYWNDEAKELKYQIADGCIIDQVLGQWLCEMAGVGEILDPEHVKKALTAIYKYNFKPSLRFHFNPCRIYGLNDEAGLTICGWPESVKKPVVPIPYSEECMHGFEYQAATHMIRCGLIQEGLSVVKGVRDRYNGEKRNPWNEMECGSNYARSMASYALLLTYSGFSFDMTKGEIGFAPLNEGSFFWSLDGAWGTFSYKETHAEIKILYGNTSIRRLRLPNTTEIKVFEKNGSPLVFKKGKTTLCFENISLSKGDILTAEYSKNERKAQ
ncbi:MAG: hypothetical protein IJD86_10500 [Clostridia bacterium]|nr:hypothetical protein [Clostridia bacterium]